MQTSENIIPKTVNPDLQKERNGASFNVEEFAIWWYDGIEKLKFKREMEEYLYKDMKEDNNYIHYKSHEEIYEYTVKETIELAHKLRNLQEQRNPGGTEIWPSYFLSQTAWGAIAGGNPFAVHFGMMVKALKSQGTDEQFEKFGRRAEKLAICGTYAQTELGHGTFLRGLETRADYDRKNDEFILNTPTLTAYKWWPGGLGHSANYCIVVANLYIDNKLLGVHMFWVQLRDEETHMPLPGVDIGDIGKKLGFYGVNNGYLGLKNVRIPRNQMLMRNAKVSSDGTYVKSPVSVLTYFTMVNVRCIIAKNSVGLLSLAATIATRYAAVRRQSPINQNEPEPQIIDHVTQQLKLFPEIATSIAYHIAANELWSLYYKTSAEIERGEYARLPELHALACAIKSLSTQDSSNGVECLRLACGGHGYLMSSNFGALYGSATAACTYEGENTVLLLQVGRFLMKSWRAAKSGQTLSSSVAYLAEVAKEPNFAKWTGSWENLKQAMQYAAGCKTRLAFENYTKRLKLGQTEGEAANNTGIEFTEAAELHGRSFVYGAFIEEITGSKSKLRSTALNKVLENLLELYLVHTTMRHLGDILRFISLTDADVSSLQRRLEEALRKIRPDAVAICDGFDYHDRSLSSTLGSYDGNVYERLFDAAKTSPLNKQPVPKAFHEHLKPFMKSNI